MDHGWRCEDVFPEHGDFPLPDLDCFFDLFYLAKHFSSPGNPKNWTHVFVFLQQQNTQNIRWFRPPLTQGIFIQPWRNWAGHKIPNQGLGSRIRSLEEYHHWQHSALGGRGNFFSSQRKDSTRCKEAPKSWKIMISGPIQVPFDRGIIQACI